MEYLNFCEKVKIQLLQLVEDTTAVRIQKVLKNNSVVRYAAIITEENCKISPSIYLENFYSDYINGKTLSDICSEIISMHKKYKGGIDFDIDNYFDYNFVKDKLYLKIINKAKNEEFLQNVPYREFCDLALIVYISLEEACNGQATIVVNNKNLEMWKVTKEQVFDTAFLNAYESTPPRLEKISTVIRELLREKCFDICDDETEEQIDRIVELMEMNNDKGMYVLTNSIKLNGAYYIMFEEYLKVFADSIDSDLFILPSSIHEILLVPMDCGVSKEELEKMVCSINNSELSPSEVLSDNVYEFYRETGFKSVNTVD